MAKETSTTKKVKGKAAANGKSSKTDVKKSKPFTATIAWFTGFWNFLRRYPLLHWILLISWIIVTIFTLRATQTEINTSAPSNEPHPIVNAPDSAASTTNLVMFGISPLIPALLALVSYLAIRYKKLRKPLFVLQIIAIVGLLTISQASLYRDYAENVVTPKAPTLQEAVVERFQCGDAVRIVDSYGFGAKTFYELKDAGWRLAATYESTTGMLNSDGACNTYYSIRDKYPADKIVLQLFTHDNNGDPAPYTYEMVGRVTVVNGIFVKD